MTSSGSMPPCVRRDCQAVAGVVFQLIFLQPDAGLGKQVHAVGVVPVHVGDDEVGDVFGLQAGSAYGVFGGLA